MFIKLVFNHKNSIFKYIINSIKSNMGCTESAEAEPVTAAVELPPPDIWEDGDDFNVDANAKRFTADKLTGEVVDRENLEDNHPEGDFFDFEEEEVVVEGDQFLAVKPWIGAVKEPDNHPEVDKSAPDVNYQLEYVYGYRCEDSRQNVYYNPDGNIVYFTAGLGVILEKEGNA